MARTMLAAVALMSLVSDTRAAKGPGDQARDAYQAGRVARDEEASRREYQRGLALARQALAANPDDPAGLLWYAANLGAEALTHGKLYALRVIGDIERTLLRLEAIAPDYDQAAAARSLGRLYHKAPAVISVGSSAKAADYFARALARAPDNPGTLAYAADFYEDRGNCPRALELVTRLRATPGFAARGPDGDEWRAIAARVTRSCS